MATSADVLKHARPRPARRSLIGFALLALGFVLAREAHLPAAACFGAAAGLLACVLATRGWAARLALAAAVVFFGAGWFATRIVQPRADALWVACFGLQEHGESRGSILVTVEGLVVERPEREDQARGGALGMFVRWGGEPVLRSLVDVDRLIGSGGAVMEVTGRVRVRVGGLGEEAVEAALFRPGDRLRLTGEFTPVEAARNPGAADRRMLAAQVAGGGLQGSLRVPSPELVEPLPPSGGIVDAITVLWIRGIARLRAGAGAALESTVGEPEARGVLRALLLGEYERSADDAASAFTRQGIVHLLAISGFHLVVIAFAGGTLIRVTGERGWMEPASVAGLVAVYMLVVPAHAPVLRAGFMVLTLLLTEALGRRYDRLTVLGWVAIALVLWRPMDLWSLGFQLSFGVVATLLWLGTAWHGRMWGVPLRGTVPGPPPGIVLTTGLWLLEQFKSLLSAGVLCWAVSAPTIAYHTGLLSPLAAITGVALVPLVSGMLLLGYSALVIGAVAPETAGLIGAVLEALSGGVIWAVRWLDLLPGTYLRLPALSIALAAAATAVVLYWFARGHMRDRRGWVLAAALAAWFAGEVLIGPAISWRGSTRVDMFSVGDGTCMLIRGGRAVDGEDAMLWDCGSQRMGLGVREIPRAVRTVGAWKVRTIIITHADLDHFSAVLDVVEPLGVRRVLVPSAVLVEAERRPDGAVAGLLEGLRERGVRVRSIGAGDVVQLGQARIEFLWPPDWLNPDAATWPRSPRRAGLLLSNDFSLVGRIRVPVWGGGERRILLTGDIGPRPIAGLIASGEDLAADVLELPHHGSASEPALHFAAAVGPHVVLQSTGPRRVGDRRWDPLRRGRAWYTTAVDGAAWVEIRGSGEVVSGSMGRGRR